MPATSYFWWDDDVDASFYFVADQHTNLSCIILVLADWDTI